MKDSLWGKEIRESKMGGEKIRTDTGVPTPELALYILLMLLLLHSINGLVSQKIDKMVQMYANESYSDRNNLFLP